MSFSPDPDELIPGLSVERVERYLAGEFTPAERAAIERALAENPDVADALSSYLARLGPADDPPPLEQSWAAVRDRRAPRPAARPLVRRPTAPVGRWALPAMLAAAACVALAILPRHVTAVHPAE